METPINDFQGLIQYIIENGIKGKSGAISLLGSKEDESSNISNYCFGIHIPYENKYKGYAFDFTYDYNTKQLLFCFAVNKGCSTSAPRFLSLSYKTSASFFFKTLCVAFLVIIIAKKKGG